MDYAIKIIRVFRILTHYITTTHIHNYKRVSFFNTLTLISIFVWKKNVYTNNTDVKYKIRDIELTKQTKYFVEWLLRRYSAIYDNFRFSCQVVHKM